MGFDFGRGDSVSKKLYFGESPDPLGPSLATPLINTLEPFNIPQNVLN